MKLSTYKNLILLSFLLLGICVQAQIPSNGNILWLRADKGVVLDAKGNVRSWNDQSGNKYNATQSTISLRPKVNAKGANGHPSIKFDGVDDYLSCPSKFPTKKSFTVITVVRFNSLSSYNTIIGGNSSFILWGGYTNKPALWYNWVNVNTSNNPVSSSFSVVSAIADTVAKKSYIYINDSLSSATKDTMQNTDNGLNIGSFYGAYTLWGELAEVIIYKRALSSVEYDSVYNYLNGKYLIDGKNPNLKLTKAPSYFQFYPRDANDSGTAKFRGNVVVSGYDSVKINVYRNDTFHKSISKPLTYSSGIAPLSFDVKFKSELAEYAFEIHLKNSSTDSIVYYKSSITSGDVFIINGQSNSIASSTLSNYTNEYVRSFGSNTAASDGDPTDTFWGEGTGANFVNFPTGCWGIVLAQKLKEKHHIPICILNGGVGGTPVSFHLRDDADPENLKTSYGRLLYRMRKAGLDSSVKAIMWYQGESNGLSGYSYQYHTLYNSWKKDYVGFQHLYIVQIHTGCGGGNGNHWPLRELLRTLPDTLGHASAVSTCNLPSHDGCHYYKNGVVDGYDSLGLHIFRMLDRDFYGSTDTLNINPPNIQKAFYTDSTQRTIGILFREKNAGLHWTADDTVPDYYNKPTIFNIRHAFYLDHIFGHVTKVFTSGDTLKLSLDTNMRFSKITYIPDMLYENTYTTYEGPWLINKRNIGALTFDLFPIDTFVPPTHASLSFNAVNNCIGGTTTFLNTSTLKLGSFTNWYWDFGDGNTSTVANPIHKYAAAGIYHIQLKSQNTTGISDSINTIIKIDSLPNAHFYKSSVNGFTYQFTPVDSTLSTYAWDFGDGSYSNQFSKKYTYSTVGEYHVNLKVSNSDNCQNSWTDSLNIMITGISPESTNAASLQIIPNPFQNNCTINFSLAKSSEIKLVLLDNLGNTVSTLINTYKNAGTYQYNLNAAELNLSKGIYQLLLLSNDNIIQRKLIKL